MKHKITIPGRRTGPWTFVTPHGTVAIDERGRASLTDAQREYFVTSHGATVEDVREFEPPVKDAATIANDASRANIEANRAAAADAETQSQTIPVPKRTRKR